MSSCLFQTNRLDEATSLAENNKEVIEKQNAQLADNDAELGLLRKRLESYESDREREKKKAALLQDALNRARAVSSDTHIVLLLKTTQVKDFSSEISFLFIHFHFVQILYTHTVFAIPTFVRLHEL